MTKKYNDWRDDAIEGGIYLHAENSRFAQPTCSEHGVLAIRKKKINIWKCNQCDFEFKVDEKHYRNWLQEQIVLQKERIAEVVKNG